ncbi:MAG TPA: flagellar basal body P-ring protein FlgI, partial [Anaerolineae bacterium]|nr:flagellar basal body P-ring protein FlgI [Anaerolineae bacterium]
GGCARIKDIAQVQGIRINQLVGYGLVVGLNGSGDGTQAKFTLQSIANMMERMGINVDPNQVKVKNAAGVMVTANLPTFVKPGQRIDCVVSSIGDAKSLQGGTLLMTPLKGPDGRIYAIAQGPVSIGGFAAGGAGAGTQKNHPTAGRIPNGAVPPARYPGGRAGAGQGGHGHGSGDGILGESEPDEKGGAGVRVFAITSHDRPRRTGTC